jgi:uncharacterized protein (TIGR02246 family)
VIAIGDIKDKIDEANKAFLKAFNTGDLTKAMKVYTDDATILPPNAEMMKRKEAITAFWQRALDMGIEKAELETVEVSQMGEDTACEIGKYVLKIHPEGAEEFTDKGKYLMIWKKIDGFWKWDMDSWNRSLPPI